MIVRPSVADISTYLQHTGWHQQTRAWRGASIWTQPEGHEVLVPARDDLGDADLRVREILAALSAVEKREPDEIASEIDAPHMDVQSYRTFPDGMPSGYTPLSVGLRAVQGVRDVVGAAARTAVEGPQPVYEGGNPTEVKALLGQVQLGPGRLGSFQFTVRTPLEPALGRPATWQLYRAVTEIAVAVRRSEGSNLGVFDETVTAGVSANLCEALSGLAGQRRRQPFEVAFRWGRGMATDALPATVRFAAGEGTVVHAAAIHLRQASLAGDAEIVGTVESLHDDPVRGDRWRIKVRGALTMAERTATDRAAWVRLWDQVRYDAAITAHRAGRRVRAAGELSTARGRVEIEVDREGFEVLE